VVLLTVPILQDVRAIQ